ncbi:hypothetical protein [Haliovirga abyssi]|uniref:DUF3313 domain-containing protein n=1 Tax=Haliovirga abyssi TaxID=2996794 RepID=A0AAU9DV90_9FUSO|nr:hypothetical protein [Haliovirga abyssi]BDU51264.1 hypothetical protein HLVA_18330 [Haliovirga abyssi]
MKKIVLGVLILLTQLGCSSLVEKKVITVTNAVKTKKTVYVSEPKYIKYNNIDITPLAQETNGFSEKNKFNEKDAKAMRDSLKESLKLNEMCSLAERGDKSEYSIKILIPNYIIAEGYGIVTEIVLILKDRSNNEIKFQDRFAVFVNKPFSGSGKNLINEAVVYKMVYDLNYYLLGENKKIRTYNNKKVKYYLGNGYQGVVRAVLNFPKRMKKVIISTSGRVRRTNTYSLNQIKWRDMIYRMDRLNLK